MASLSVAVLAAAMSCAAPSFAEEVEAPGDSTVFDPVIVTARKREEVAQTVPISITTYDQRSIERLNIDNLQDLRTTAPSVYIAQSTFRTDTINVTIRG